MLPNGSDLCMAWQRPRTSQCHGAGRRLTRADKILVTDLPNKIQEYRDNQTMLAGGDPTELVPLEEIERRYIEHVLKATDGNQRKPHVLRSRSQDTAPQAQERQAR